MVQYLKTNSSSNVDVKKEIMLRSTHVNEKQEVIVTILSSTATTEEWKTFAWSDISQLIPKCRWWGTEFSLKSCFTQIGKKTTHFLTHPLMVSSILFYPGFEISVSELPAS